MKAKDVEIDIENLSNYFEFSDLSNNENLNLDEIIIIMLNKIQKLENQIENSKKL